MGSERSGTLGGAAGHVEANLHISRPCLSLSIRLHTQPSPTVVVVPPAIQNLFKVVLEPFFKLYSQMIW